MLKLQNFCHLLQKASSLEKTLSWERLKANERRMAEDEMVDGITDSVDMNLSQLWEIVKDRGAWRAVSMRL